MLHTIYSTRGMFVAPHALAAQAGRDVLAEGGSAIEAMVAAAATIAVVYPHMNSIGGDGFWLISKKGLEPVAVRASGISAALADIVLYKSHGCTEIPSRGALAALTVPGCIGGWIRALEERTDTSLTGKKHLPLARLLEPAIRYAREGFPVTQGQTAVTKAKLGTLKGVSGFDETFLLKGEVPAPGTLLKQPALADTLETLARDGLESFYTGSVAERMAKELEAIGSPLRLADFKAFWEEGFAAVTKPLTVRTKKARLFNMVPPTQGAASLMILGIFERLLEKNPDIQCDSPEYVHALVEATKEAFVMRNASIVDPRRMKTDAQDLITPEAMDVAAERISMTKASPWERHAKPGDTIWMGTIDEEGTAVSYIQSTYWEYGSGVVLKDTGVTMQNRGCSFSLDETHINALAPRAMPFHTLNPAMALFDDGRTMVYGTMGGEGQPQTQSAVYSRYAFYGVPLQEAVTRPRWLLGRTWGEKTSKLRLEPRFAPEVVEKLRAMGHSLETVAEEYSDTMGHAGAVVRHPDGVMEGAVDPRSDGIAAPF